jgi:hypothetical protein
MRVASLLLLGSMLLQPAANAGPVPADLAALLQAAGLTLPETTAAQPPHAPQSFQLRWQTSGAGSETGFVAVDGAAGGRFSLTRYQPAAGPPARRRAPQISPEQLVVVAVDPQGEVQGWELIPDPRLLRSELPDAQGELRSRTFYRTDTAFTVTLAADPETTEVRLYQPSWNGETLSLEPLAVLALP